MTTPLIDRMAMDDDIIEELHWAIDDAICDGEGRVYDRYLRLHLEKAGLRVIRVEKDKDDAVG